MTFDRDNIIAKADDEATVWQWFAEAHNHEMRHVYHNARYGCAPWNNRADDENGFWRKEKVPSWVPRSQGGEEIHTMHKAVAEYFEELGVRSPQDRNYDPSRDKQLNCPLW